MQIPTFYIFAPKKFFHVHLSFLLSLASEKETALLLPHISFLSLLFGLCPWACWAVSLSSTYQFLLPCWFFSQENKNSHLWTNQPTFLLKLFLFVFSNKLLEQYRRTVLYFHYAIQLNQTIILNGIYPHFTVEESRTEGVSMTQLKSTRPRLVGVGSRSSIPVVLRLSLGQLHGLHHMGAY